MYQYMDIYMDITYRLCPIVYLPETQYIFHIVIELELRLYLLIIISLILSIVDVT